MLAVEAELNKEFDSTLKYTKRLQEKIALMVDVIRAQQAYAGTSQMTEEMNLSEIVNDTLTLQKELLDSFGIQVKKNFERVPKVRIENTANSFSLSNQHCHWI